MRDRIETKSQMREDRMRNIEVRLLALTPTSSTPEPTHSPVPVVRSKSYSKSSRLYEKTSLMQSLKTRIMAHEPEVLPVLPTPKKRPGLVVFTPTSEVSPAHFAEMGDITPYLVFHRSPGFRPTEVLHAGLVRSGLQKVGTEDANLLVKVSPAGGAEHRDGSPMYQNAWEARQRKEYFKRITLNQRRLEVSKRNLWKNKQL